MGGVAFEISTPIASHVNGTKKIQNFQKQKQEAQGLGALLDKMEDNDHIKLDNIVSE